MSVFGRLGSIFRRGEKEGVKLLEGKAVKEAEKTVFKDISKEELEMAEKDGMKELEKAKNLEENELKEMVKKEEGKGIAASLKDKIKNVWENKGAFAKWAAGEILAGALFQTASEGVEIAFDKWIKEHPEKLAQEKVEKIQTILKETNKANRTLKPILDGWSDWLAGHMEQQDKYGANTTDDGDEIPKFEVVQHKVAHIGTYRDHEVTPALDEFHEVKDLETAQRYLQKYIEYVQEILSVSTNIKDKQSLMVGAGLQAHTEEVRSTLNALKAIPA
ncbi:hypothetical protein BFJ70_g6771 [Fusarium oxysporum]|nr:hypothetical protein BFJ70_g6771 [Fusarium oxysporum]